MFNNLWTEKYRPHELRDLVLSSWNRTYFEGLKDEIPNMLFIGTPGIGKTTIAKIIVQDVLKCQYLYINASDENGIDTIRTKVSNFAQTRSIDGKVKVVILDEADGITLDGQRALRNTMEEHSGYTRFILTANYKHKIIPAIQSRTQHFDLTPEMADVVERVIEIIKEEGVYITAEQKPKLGKLFRENYHDIRKTINLVQKYSITGKLNIEDTIDSNAIAKVMMEHISSNKLMELRKYLIENEAEFQGDYANLLKTFLNTLYEKTDLKEDSKRKAIVTIAEHLYRDAFVLDKEINAFACLCQLQGLF
jgi:DNA polymerase III delta prime subunit